MDALPSSAPDPAPPPGRGFAIYGSLAVLLAVGAAVLVWSGTLDGWFAPGPPAEWVELEEATDGMLQAGTPAEVQGHARAVTKAAQAFIARHPTDARVHEARYRFAVARFRLGELDGAGQLLQQVDAAQLTDDSRRGEFHALNGLYLQATGELLAAREAYYVALELPIPPAAARRSMYGLGQAALQLGMSGEAKAVFQDLSRSHGGTREAEHALQELDTINGLLGQPAPPRPDGVPWGEGVACVVFYGQQALIRGELEALHPLAEQGLEVIEVPLGDGHRWDGPLAKGWRVHRAPLTAVVVDGNVVQVDLRGAPLLEALRRELTSSAAMPE